MDICHTIEDCGLPTVELNFGCPHPAMMPGVHGGGMIGQVRPTWRPR
jgi:dihydroorotate dehydrogenase (fumarate)/dihydropyrimidine dehydrogenase (NAD+) subunit PreA